MGGVEKLLTVAPFECAWHEELRFKEAGRGCLVFEAFAQNDITLVFREQLGSQHYHYKLDNCPRYTIIFGSHKNRMLKIEADGQTVANVAGVGLCSSSFENYWICIYDGLISIGKGKFPFHNLVFQWHDKERIRNVQYVGLSSWDKHVQYRNFSIFPLTLNCNILRGQVNFNNIGSDDERGECFEDGNCASEHRGLADFLHNWEFSDVRFIVDTEKRVVPGHKIVLNASGEFPVSENGESTIELPTVSYCSLHALLEYIYTGQTLIEQGQLSSLHDLSAQFKVTSLMKRCKETIEQLKRNKKLFDSGKKVAIACTRVRPFGSFPFPASVDLQKIEQCFVTGAFSDVNIHIDCYGVVARSHKLILSLWSLALCKMFTNGMLETNSSGVLLKDVSPESFTLLLNFMYSGDVKMESSEISSAILELLRLADQFDIPILQQECVKHVMENLSEDTVCDILHHVASLESYKLLEETCKRNFAMHFDYCTTTSNEFIFLDETTFRDILEHDEMTVTSEERVLDAIMTWCAQSSEVCGWTTVNELLGTSTVEHLFKERFSSLATLLPLVRFPLMPRTLLQKLEDSRLHSNIRILSQMVEETKRFSVSGLTAPATHGERFKHRRSSYKELHFIYDGDSNGVIYYIGASYGDHSWVNPVLAKKIVVSASSPPSRYTDPKALVSRTYQATCFAGPQIKNGQHCTWWMIDLGKDHQLMCNYYTLRQDGSTTYMRSWAFQGSVDGENWSNLRVHGHDATICRPAQFASWPITGPSALLPFRFFRVVLTGPTVDELNAWSLCVCFVELYGYFR